MHTKKVSRLAYYSQWYKDFYLLFQHNFLMLFNTYYSQNYASIMYQGPMRRGRRKQWEGEGGRKSKILVHASVVVILIPPPQEVVKLKIINYQRIFLVVSFLAASCFTSNGMHILCETWVLILTLYLLNSACQA